MQNLVNKVKTLHNFIKSESGATLVEYGVALILAIVLGGGALVTLSDQVGVNMVDAVEAMQTR